MVWKRSSVTDPDELEYARLIDHRLRQGRHVRARFEIVSGRGIGAGSPLAGDDAATAWMHLSHVAVTSLTMATDNMRAVEKLLRPKGTLEVPMYAHYPVVRSILEASALSKWLLVPDERRERIVRLLRARHEDVVQDTALSKVELAAVEAMDVPPAESVLAEQRALNDKRRERDVAKLKEIALAHAVSWTTVKRGLPRWSELVREVCALPQGAHGMSVPGQYAEGVWKVASGLSHPSLSRMARNSDVERLGASLDGTVMVRLTASLRWTHEALLVAYNTANEAVELLDHRSVAHVSPSFMRTTP